MAQIDTADWRMLGILPALGLPSDADVLFSPFAILSFGAACQIDPDAGRWRPLVQRYAAERRAPRPEQQAVVFARRDCVELVATLWPLVMLAFTGYARRSCSGGPDFGNISAPEAFLCPAVTPYKAARDDGGGSFVYQSAASEGFGRAEHIPLWWGVDGPSDIHGAGFDNRVHAALAAISEHPAKFAEMRELRAIGAAADLCCASMEHYPQKISNVAPVTRRMTLLQSGFEALHRVHENELNHWNRVAAGVAQRFKTAHRSLLANSLSSGSVETGELREGTSKSVLEFALHRMAYLRNRLAHGWTPDELEYKFDDKLGGAHIETLSRLVLTILIGQDLVELSGGPRYIGTADPKELYGRNDSSRLLEAHYSGMAFDRALEEGLCSPFGMPTAEPKPTSGGDVGRE
jgi:hypothetical protein